MIPRIIKFSCCLISVVVGLSITATPQGKTQKPPYLLRVIVAEQPDAPIKLTADAVFCPSRFKCPIAPDNSYSEPIANISLKLENISAYGIVGYALVSQGSGFHNIQVNALINPLGPGEHLNRGFGTGGSEELQYSIDSVLFADGRVWGKDKFRRSKQMAHYIEGRRDAFLKLTDLSSAYPEPAYFLDLVKGFGFISHDPAGPPSRERLKTQYRLGWIHVIQRLLSSPKRQRESIDLATLLEAAIPANR